MNTYITPFDYLRSATGQETASLVSNLSRLSVGVGVGATQLPLVPATTSQLNPGDRLIIFDGQNSEIASVALGTAAGSNTVQVSALQYAHGAQTALCGDGAKGSLADEILTASDMVEDYCLQSLLLATRTDTLALGTLRASISKDGVLVMRPMSFPINAVSALSIQTPGATIVVDVSQAFLDGRQQLVTLYQLLPQGMNQGGVYQSTVNQRISGNVNVTYTSGFAFNAMPYKVRKACILFTSDLLSKRRNPTGGSDVMSGKVRVKYGHIGDTSGESDLVKQAHDLLSSFVMEDM